MLWLSRTVEAIRRDVVDFHGQNLGTNLLYCVLGLGTVVGVVVGHVRQDFTLTMAILGAATALAVVICAPAWPIFCRNQIRWKAAKHSD
ncbi:microsomal signal peptidase protein, putative [Babesia caballi]|uniref:Signal peptidase complex subunit 1 n=1 Tax=Babesia caballi TaxID=5871 RepID=A0AAV4M242_BABCB|nr:microsomal signal peptidase protein, putative [Babesia caballi]